MRLISRSWWIADKHTLTRTRQLEVSAPCPACSQPLLPLKLRNIPIDLASPSLQAGPGLGGLQQLPPRELKPGEAFRYQGVLAERL